METLRGMRQACRVKVKIDGEEKVGRLLFGSTFNMRPIGDDVHLEPLGWFKTDKVEFLELLLWSEDGQSTAKPSQMVTAAVGDDDVD